MNFNKTHIIEWEDLHDQYVTFAIKYRGHGIYHTSFDNDANQDDYTSESYTFFYSDEALNIPNGSSWNNQVFVTSTTDSCQYMIDRDKISMDDFMIVIQEFVLSKYDESILKNKGFIELEPCTD